MNDWVGLGFDGSPVVRGMYVDESPKWYSKQLGITPRQRERQRLKLEERKSEMDLMWEGMRDEHG